MNEKDFIKEFESKTLSPEKFDHKGHLWLGWLYIRDYPLAQATQKLNTGIKSFAESLGAKDKFHYTLTTTLACAIKSRFQANQTFEQFLSANQDLVDDALKIIHTHYSPERLFSTEAKIALVEPDRLAFPDNFKKELIKLDLV